MDNTFRQYLVDKLMDSVSRIGGSRFERFGTRLIDMYVGEPMVHRGLDALGNPQGYTVDSISTDGRTAAEYGAVDRYFDGKLKKPTKDWNHVRNKHPHATRILLVSDERCGPDAHTALMNLPTSDPAAAGIQLEILDSQRIAEIIADTVLPSDTKVESLAEFVPLLAQLRDEYVATHLAPNPVDDYLQREDIERRVVELMDSSKVAALAGIGGLGKSQTAASVAAALRRSGACETVVWIDASEVDSVDALKGVEIDRRGRRVNALALTRITSALLILDDLRVDIDFRVLSDACGSKARVLVTRQTIGPDDIAVPLLDDKEARRLLQHGLAGPVPQEVFDAVWSTVNGHPLSLRLLGSTAAEVGDWYALVDECAHIAEYPMANRPGRVADRLLARMAESAPKELAFFLWCDARSVDMGFARRVLGIQGLKKLRSAGLLAVDSADSLRLHDIVAASLLAVPVPVDRYAPAFEDGLREHINRVAFRAPHRLELLRLVHLHRGKLAELVRARREVDEFLYALLLVWDEAELELKEIGDLRDRVRRIADAPGTIPDASALCVAEAIEVIFLRTRAERGHEAAKAALGEHLSLLGDVERAPGISDDARDSIRHHRAKALRRLGQLDEGIAICREILDGSRPSASTRLLLARLLLDSKNEGAARDAGTQLLAMLDEAVAAPAGAELSATLAAIEEFAAKQLEWAFVEAWRRHGDFIADQIVAGAALGMAWAVEAFARVAARWEWHDPEGFRRVAARLLPHAMDVDGDDRQLAARGRILIALSRSAEAEQRAALLAQVVANFKAMSKRDSFQTYEFGKALVEAGAYAEAAALLEPLRDGGSPWLRYRLSQAYLGLGRVAEAFDLAEELCAATPSTDTYYSTYRRHRFHVRRARGDADAIEDLRAAYEACVDPKYREQLVAELDVAVGELESERVATER